MSHRRTFLPLYSQAVLSSMGCTPSADSARILLDTSIWICLGTDRMRSFLKKALSISVFCCVFAMPPGRPIATDDVAITTRTERSLMAALAKGDQKAVAALLDPDFQWVEANGKTHTKAQVLEDLTPFATDNQDAIDVRTLDLLGQGQRILGNHHNQRFAHIWVNRPAGWQALIFLDVPIPVERPEYTAIPKPPANPNADCENPCRTLPYKPENAAQEGALAAWFRLKNAEWHPNPEVWDANSDENHETISPRGDLPKLEHVAQLAQQRKMYGEKGANPGQPVLSMRMFDVGNVVVQECLEGPKGATKPTTFALRVFINRGTGWKIVLSGHTNIGQLSIASN